MTTNPKAIISIVVPAFNEAKRIESCLISLKQQDFEKYELIVVDNNSSDDTARIAMKYANIVIPESRVGCGQARQTGFEFAHADIIATTDADTVVGSDWLSRIYAHYCQDSEIVAVHGPIKYTSDGSKFKRLISTNASYFYLWFHHIIGLPFMIGTNFSVKKYSAKIIGGFNTELQTGSDLDFSLRLRRQGKIIFDKDLIVMASARNIRYLYIITNYLRMLIFRTSHKRKDIR